MSSRRQTSATKRGGKDIATTSDVAITSASVVSSTTRQRHASSTSSQSQSQSPSDLEDGVLNNSSNSNDINNGKFLSPELRADFNARQEERRKQRRDERTRRKQRREQLQFHGLGGLGTAAATRRRSSFLVVLACAFCCILLGWFLAFLYLARDMDFLHNDGNGAIVNYHSPMRVLAMNRGKILKAIGNNIKEAIHEIPNKIPKPFGRHKNKDGNPVIDNVPTLKGNPNDVVDMRVMTAELPFDNVDGGAWKQGWDVEPVDIDDKSKPPLRIFVVPHSHCDPGWIQTFDEYFQSQTKQILSAVIESLLKNPKRRFIWAEISYFEWWWKEQTKTTQNDVRMLLDQKRFEFVTGGWVQPDEANTQLYAMEIQLEEGHDFIRNTFGEKYIPKYGWSIDPFGYSPTMAYLLKKHGFKAMLIQRVHYAVKKELALHKNLEFMWRQTWDDKGDFDIFTHVMPFYSYDVPHTCGPDPSVCCQFDYARLGQIAHYVALCPWNKQPQLINHDNIRERSLLLLDQYRKKANLYRTNTVLVPLGDDFRYRDINEADLIFEQYQKIFDYINTNVDNVEISFGTLSEYFETILTKRPFSPPLLKGSFFTYSDREEDYWSGYFTSRIFDKALDRKLERVLYAASSLGATKAELQGPRRALSLFQHHDGVTGTAKTAVVEDYAKRIHGAISETQNWILRHLVADNEHDHGRSAAVAKQLRLQACWQSTAPRGLSQNLCEQSENKNETPGSKTKIIVYNPLETEQSCGSAVIPGRTIAHATLPCETPGPLPPTSDGHGRHRQPPSGIEFDPSTGLMIHPVREEWMVWKVRQGGAYLFFPGKLGSYNELDLDIRDGGSVVVTKHWKRTVVERKLRRDDSLGAGVAIDFVYETNLQTDNEEWFARFTSPDIQNRGVFHTDLNGYNFDTHHYRSDMPIQSQVFPMPTLASIEDANKRMTVLSEHAQGAASLEESAIDVWLDRRLAQDDARGLMQGVRDNVPTRTRLRVVLEDRTPEASTVKEFEITPFCKRQWKELNHPLEMFGTAGNSSPGMAGLGMPDITSIELDNRRLQEKLARRDDATSNYEHALAGHGNVPIQVVLDASNKYSMAAVYMVHKRLDYLKRAIDTLRESDYPKSMPIIISHDGHIQEMVDYVEDLKSEFQIIQLFHPYSCADHPNEFPGDDPKLNENYKGDNYGNPREGKITCCKHHFAWLMNTVFGMEEIKMLDGFLFMEEDYIVAPTIYQTIQKGFDYIDTNKLRDEFFGLTLDPTNGYAQDTIPAADWIVTYFLTGPMAFRREMFAKIKAHPQDFCNWDEYNWDWSIVHMMIINDLPQKVLVPGTLQVAHIGLVGGMHPDAANERIYGMNKYVINGKLAPFFADVGVPRVETTPIPALNTQGFGGWGHPADQKHCMKLFTGEA